MLVHLPLEHRRRRRCSVTRDRKLLVLWLIMGLCLLFLEFPIVGRISLWFGTVLQTPPTTDQYHIVTDQLVNVSICFGGIFYLGMWGVLILIFGIAFGRTVPRYFWIGNWGVLFVVALQVAKSFATEWFTVILDRLGINYDRLTIGYLNPYKQWHVVSVELLAAIFVIWLVMFLVADRKAIGK